MEKIQLTFEKVKSEIRKVVIGQEEVIGGILLSLMVGGHVLLEGPPGIAKTLTAKAIAKTISATYKRVQFTPDLMPLDLIGTNLFDFHKQQFIFKSGTIFTDLLLADEINRTPPKTQAALLEAMEEKQVTVDGNIHPLSPIFMVIATQNPIEYEGTYPLPEAQLDRFLLKLNISYPDTTEETQIYQHYQNGVVSQTDLNQISPVVTIEEILALRSLLNQVQVRAEIFDYLYQIIKATRNHPLLMLGASPRAGIFVILVAKAYAASQGRNYVIPDDIIEIAGDVLRHRLIVKPEAQIDGKTSDHILKQILHEIKVPR
ncbi:MAG TPA: MoxR family ATPase [Bacillota bacterium]|nr:MoxR family ATPase [Bacillota bacterium]HOL09204.1 MoxR family ATPase [Bacillota bacterium]HPO97028.1 MoxR family ATPase [Bacillota bacterium]